MNRFSYNRGTWENENPLPEWEDSEDFSDYIKRVGFNAFKTTFGHEYGSQIEIYESSDGESFYASVCPSGNNCYEVYLPDFPSLMMFLKDHATAFSAESSNYNQQEILKLLEKLFQIQHGHSASTICRTCDPEGYAETSKAQENRLRVKIAEG